MPASGASPKSSFGRFSVYSNPHTTIIGEAAHESTCKCIRAFPENLSSNPCTLLVLKSLLLSSLYLLLVQGAQEYKNEQLYGQTPRSFILGLSP
jgi:hypothetical protein